MSPRQRRRYCRRRRNAASLIAVINCYHGHISAVCVLPSAGELREPPKRAVATALHAAAATVCAADVVIIVVAIAAAGVIIDV